MNKFIAVDYVNGLFSKVIKSSTMISLRKIGSYAHKENKLFDNAYIIIKTNRK